MSTPAIGDFGDAARRMHEEMLLRQQYDYLFAAERDRLERRIVEMEDRNRALILEVSESRQKIRRLEVTIENADRKRGNGRGGKPKGRNRVIYWVTVYTASELDARLLGETLWEERRKTTDGPEPGIKVQTFAASGRVLKLVIDYTVKGGNEGDLWRNDPGSRPGMLNRVAERLGVTVLDVECDERSRVPVEDDQMPSEGL